MGVKTELSKIVNPASKGGKILFGQITYRKSTIKMTDLKNRLDSTFI